MKRILFLFTLLACFTGCSVQNISSTDMNAVITNALSSEDITPNTLFDGYKYYLPRGFQLIDKKDYNSKLLSNGHYYYLYVDVVSYYHQSDLDYKADDSLYFSREISYKDKKGYIEITKHDSSYFLKIVYNYAKIESYVEEALLNEAIYNSIKVLSSVTYNDVVLNSIMGENILDYQEEEYNLFESKRENGNFLDYIEEYDVYDEKEHVKDEDLLDSENE